MKELQSSTISPIITPIQGVKSNEQSKSESRNYTINFLFSSFPSDTKYLECPAKFVLLFQEHIRIHRFH